MSYHGNITLGDTIDIKFSTVDTGGVPTTLAGTPAISAYPGNSTTQITAGITLTVDFDSVTGLHNVRIAATSGNGYAAATNYTLVITTGTVDGVSVVGYVIGSFSISNRTTGVSSIAANVITATAIASNALTSAKFATDAITAAKLAADAGSEIATAVWASATRVLTANTNLNDPTAATIRAEIDSNSTQLAAIVADTNELQTDDYPTSLAAILADTGELQTDWADGGRLDLILDARASQTTADAIETDTQDIQSRIPAALASGNMKSDVIAISGSIGAADNLEASVETIITGQAQTGTLTTTVMTTDLTEATDDHYIGRVVIWTSGVLIGQASDITDYSGTNGTLTYTAVTEAPSNGDTFVII